MVVGEGPGAEEDRRGKPFVGRAGQYLDRWLAAVGLDRTSNCFIGNIVKCRPPGNRDPLPEESAACMPYLKEQIDILKPKAILTLGRIATQILCGRSEGIGKLRGEELDYLGIPVVPTYHPSAVLRNTDLRPAVWEDLKRLRALPELAEQLGDGPAADAAGSRDHHSRRSSSKT
jgi:DNA polymerase